MDVSEKTTVWKPQAEAARITGIPSRTVREWVSNRSIAIGEGSQVDVIELLIRDRDRHKAKSQRLENSVPDSNPQKRLTLAQCRKIEAEAKLREFELRRLEGEFIALSEAIADFETALIAARNKLLALPTRLSLQLSGMGGQPREIAQLLEDVICEALAALSAEFAEAGE